MEKNNKIVQNIFQRADCISIVQKELNFVLGGRDQYVLISS